MGSNRGGLIRDLVQHLGILRSMQPIEKQPDSRYYERRQSIDKSDQDAAAMVLWWAKLIIHKADGRFVRA
jgi:hypothetical protein